MATVIGLEIESVTVIASENGFLGIERNCLRNRRSDGTQSDAYICDLVTRPVGLDAVCVVIFRRADGVDVLLRDGLRPALALGRKSAGIPVKDTKKYLYFREVVAGILETEDMGIRGIKSRAAQEVWEEAGLRVAAESVFELGAALFPSPATIPEKLWFCAVEVGACVPLLEPEGDGSPMEEGAVSTWVPLDDAIRACVSGEVEDMKTEVALRRLRDYLA